jgi:hypothetical protein
VGSSFISYRGRGFWSHDAFIESFLARLAEASVSLGPSDWVHAAAAHWRLQASGNFGGWVHPLFDEHLVDDDRRIAVLGLVSSIRARPDVTPELVQTCELMECLLKGDLQTDASSPLDYMVKRTEPPANH